MLIFDFLILIFLLSNVLSYFIIKLIYRKVFKSQKKISKSLVFFGSIVLMIFYYTPYSYYLEPSFWEFRRMCKLDSKIYQAKGGKLDEEYYNKVLAYFDTSLEKLDWDYIQKDLFLNDFGEYVYDFTKKNDRINFSFFIFFKDKRATRDNIETVWTYIDWRDLRPRLAGNEGTGFYLSGDREICSVYFEK